MRVNEYLRKACSVQLLHCTLILRIYLYSNLTVPAAPEININTKIVMNVTFDHFSTLCKNFTIAMSLKYQVQDLLFNTDTTPELSKDNIQNLPEILTSLQTIATALGDLQFHKDHNRCIRLTAAQYRIMYYVQHPNTTLIQALKGITEFWKLIDGIMNIKIYTVKSYIINIIILYYFIFSKFY